MTTLGPYTLLRRLGTGGMGEVWIARRAALGGAAKLVAIKTVLPEKASNAESRRMFLDEARLSMLMTNSNIVQVFDVDETGDGICYMAMEYVDGIDLARLCEHLIAVKEQLSQSAIAYIIGEILKALSYAHEFNVEGTRRTIVHRDISPQNVMVSVSGEVKVMDFGIARLSCEETSGIFVKGKIRYMPPEQFQKGVRAPTLDLFAVGAILHELLDGQRFRSGDHEQAELLGMCIRGAVPPLSCPPGRVPWVFEQLRKGLLEPNPGKRIQSAREAHRLLSRWPGDRDAKFELEEVVRRFVGESSLTSAAVASGGSGEGAKSPSEIVQPIAPTELVKGTCTTTALPGNIAEIEEEIEEFEPDLEPEFEGPQSNDEMTDIRRIGEVSDTQSDIPQAVLGYTPGPSRRTRRLAGAFAFAAGLSAAGFAAASDWWSSGEAEPAEIDRPEPIVIKAKPVPPAETAPSEAPEPAPVLEPEPEPEPEPTSKAKRTTKTAVTLTAGGVWMQVKIGRRQFTFDRLEGAKPITTRLAPGEYMISSRNDPDAGWKPLGKVRISAGSPVKLDIRGGKFTVGK